MSNSSPESRYRILLVDDQTGIHADYRKVLARETRPSNELRLAREALFGDAPGRAQVAEFELTSAYQGEEALQKVLEAEAAGQPFSVAFVDMRMPPGWDGLQTIESVWKVCPDLQIVLCTAFTDYTWEDIAGRIGPTDRLVVLMKPFENVEVLQLAHALTEKWRLLQVTRLNTAKLESGVWQRTSELRAANDQLLAEMMARSLAENAFRQAQKMEAVGQLAGGLAHDFNNLISVIRGFGGLLLMEGKHDDPTRESLVEIDQAADRAASLTRQLLTFSRRQVMQPQNLDPNEVIAQVTKLLHCLVGETIDLKFQLDRSIPGVHADRMMLEQVLVNLAVNARDAMPEGGALTITSSLVELTEEEARLRPHASEGRFVCLSVRDTGCGISPENMPRLFEPFYTTKEVGRGTGLGLATVYGIVRQHEGWSDVKSTLGAGTLFRISLPAIELGPDSVALSGGLTCVRGDETILLVEDEPAVRNVARLALQSYGYRVYTAESGHDALSVWPKHATEIDLILTDIVMPGGISGRDLGERLQAEKLGLKVIYSSGYSREVANRAGLLKEGLNFLPKPYVPFQLARFVRTCLDTVGQVGAIHA